MKTKKTIMMFVFFLAVVVLAGTTQAAPTAGDVEDAVEADLGLGEVSTYLDFTNSSTGYSRHGLTISQSASGDNWGYPDSSNTELFVNEDSLDDKEHGASDFEITITGLGANKNYDVYYCEANGDQPLRHDFSWGRDSDGAAVNFVLGVPGQPGAVEVIPVYYAVPLGYFTADGTGTLKMWVGKAQAWSAADQHGTRTQLDGLVILPREGDVALIVDAGPDQVIVWPDDEVTLAAEIQDDGDPNEVLKYWWEVTGQPAGSNVNLTNPTGLGPFQITVKEGGDVEPNQPYAVTPTVKVDQSGIYELRLNVRDEKSDSNDTVRIFVYPAGYEGLAAHWKLDDGIDTGPTTLIAEDSSGSLDPNLITYLIERHYHNGDLIGETGPSEPNWTSGVDSPLTLQDFKGALWFDGVDDYVEIPSEDGLQLTKNFTISAWIYPRTVGDYMTIISKVTNTSNKQYFLWVKDSAELEYGFEAGGGNDGGEDGGEVVAGEWQHVAVTMDSDLFITLYINGSVVDTKQETLTPEIRDDNINIGRFGGSYEDRYFDGYIDDVRIYPEAKSNEEIIVIAGIENPPPTVDAGDSYHTWLGDLPLTTLAGTVGDGPPGDVADAGVAWSITGTPEGANATVEKTSTLPEEWANPTADFTTDTVGTYEITLRATDATELTGSDTLEIQVWSDACEAAQEAPSWTGFNIFDTDQNCVVDLIDYAAFAAQWLADLRLTTPEAY